MTYNDLTKGTPTGVLSGSCLCKRTPATCGRRCTMGRSLTSRGKNTMMRSPGIGITDLVCRHINNFHHHHCLASCSKSHQTRLGNLNMAKWIWQFPMDCWIPLLKACLHHTKLRCWCKHGHLSQNLHEGEPFFSINSFNNFQVAFFLKEDWNMMVQSGFGDEWEPGC